MCETTTTCRLCLRTTDGVNGSTITDQDFRNMMSSVFYFWIPNGYALPKSVCLKCYSTVRDFYCYSQTVQANQQLVKQDPRQLDCEPTSETDSGAENAKLDEQVKMEPIPVDSDEDADDTVTETVYDCGKESNSGTTPRNCAPGNSQTKKKAEPHLENEDRASHHRKDKGRSERVEDDATQRSECPVCKKTFGFHYLKHHISSHRDTLRCEVCAKTFSTKKGLTRHKTTVHAFPKKLSLYELNELN